MCTPVSASEHGRASPTVAPQFPCQQRTGENSATYPLPKSDLREQLTNSLHQLLHRYHLSVYLLTELKQKEYSRNKAQRQDPPLQIFADASEAVTHPGLPPSSSPPKIPTATGCSCFSAAGITDNGDISKCPSHSTFLWLIIFKC